MKWSSSSIGWVSLDLFNEILLDSLYTNHLSRNNKLLD